MYFHEYFVDFDGDFGAFDKSGSYNFVPNKRPPPPFSLFSKLGALKGANTVRYIYHKMIQLKYAHTMAICK